MHHIAFNYNAINDQSYTLEGYENVSAEGVEVLFEESGWKRKI